MYFRDSVNTLVLKFDRMFCREKVVEDGAFSMVRNILTIFVIRMRSVKVSFVLCFIFLFRLFIFPAIFLIESRHFQATFPSEMVNVAEFDERYVKKTDLCYIFKA